MGSAIGVVCPCQSTGTDPYMLDLLIKVFAMLDAHRTGCLNLGHLQLFGVRMCMQWDVHYIDMAVRRVGVVNTQAIELQNFIHFVENELPMTQQTCRGLETYLQSERLRGERLSLLAQVFDRADCSDQRGVIDHDHFLAFGRFLNSELDEQKIDEILRQISVTGEDRVTRDEFIQFFSKPSDPEHDQAFNRRIRSFLECDVQPTTAGHFSATI